MLSLRNPLPAPMTASELNAQSIATSLKCLPDTRVVFLVNFVAPNLLDVFRQLASRVGQFTVLSSVANEQNRQWQVETRGLNVRWQKTWTLTRTARHPSGYREPNYVHLPLDTLGQLHRLHPDVVISLELGTRTVFSQIYRRLHPAVVHVATILASERSEAGRGWLRRSTRRSLLKLADGITFNGPSCRRYLMSLGADETKFAPWDYAADPRKFYSGPLSANDRAPQAWKLLTVGQLSERKGILQAAAALSRYAAARPQTVIRWTLVGDGPLRSSLAAMTGPENLQLQFRGHCDANSLREQYRDHDLMLFPTLGDEWGLVVDESLASGLPVLGSCHSQAVETLIRDGLNGYTFDPESTTSLDAALDRWSDLSSFARQEMRTAGRNSMLDRTPRRSASQLIDAIVMAMQRRGLDPRVEDSVDGTAGETQP